MSFFVVVEVIKNIPLLQSILVLQSAFKLAVFEANISINNNFGDTNYMARYYLFEIYIWS